MCVGSEGKGVGQQLFKIQKGGKVSRSRLNSPLEGPVEVNNGIKKHTWVETIKAWSLVWSAA